jgi:hypothetical protein
VLQKRNIHHEGTKRTKAHEGAPRPRAEGAIEHRVALRAKKTLCNFVILRALRAFVVKFFSASSSTSPSERSQAHALRAKKTL